MKTLSGLPGKPASRVMVIYAVVKCGHVRTNKTVPVRVDMSSDLKTVQVSKYSVGEGWSSQKKWVGVCGLRTLVMT